MARSMSTIPGPASRATIITPRRSPSETSSIETSPPRLKRTMLRAISEMAVAMTVASVSEKPTCNAIVAAPLPGGHDVRVDPHRDHRHVGIAWLPIEQGAAQRGAEAAVEQVVPGIDRSLPSAVTGRQRQQDRAAAGRGRLTVQLQQVLDAQLGPGPVQLGSHCSGGGTETIGQRSRVLARHLVGDQHLSLIAVQTLQRSPHGLGLLALQHVLLRIEGGCRIEQSMLVALAGVGASPPRGHQVAGGHDGVRTDRTVVEPPLRRQHPSQRLLHDVVDDVSIRDTARDDPTHQRDQITDVPAEGILEGSRHRADVTARPVDPASPTRTTASPIDR